MEILWKKKPSIPSAIALQGFKGSAIALTPCRSKANSSGGLSGYRPTPTGNCQLRSRLTNSCIRHLSVRRPRNWQLAPDWRNTGYQTAQRLSDRRRPAVSPARVSAIAPTLPVGVGRSQCYRVLLCFATQDAPNRCYRSSWSTAGRQPPGNGMPLPRHDFFKGSGGGAGLSSNPGQGANVQSGPAPPRLSF